MAHLGAAFAAEVRHVSIYQLARKTSPFIREGNLRGITC